MLPQIEKLREKGVIKGEATGFKCLDELYSVKQGTYTFVYAEPKHGKSEFIFEMCFNQTRYGKRSLICSPETGSIDEIIAELIHKHTGKQIYKTSNFSLSDVEFHNSIAFLTEYFVVLETDDKTYSVKELFNYADQWEIEHPGKRIDIIVGEPYNELNHDEMANKFGARQDLYVEDLISIMRRLCRKHKRHFFLSIHPNGSALPITKGGITYYPKPLPRQASSGQALYRKAMTWITLWRPPVGLNDDSGFAYRDNEVHIHIDKAKPKGVSFIGKCVMYFDWKRNRYFEGYETDPNYAFQHEVTIDKFIMPASQDFDDKPF